VSVTLSESLLKMGLEVSVPLFIDRVRREYTEEQRFARARECAQIVASKGDVILHKSKTRGETADAYNALAEGLACAAFQPGGVTFLGMHFEAL
jgi:hypothetical protein